jgi:hypothetical protein
MSLRLTSSRSSYPPPPPNRRPGSWCAGTCRCHVTGDARDCECGGEGRLRAHVTVARRDAGFGRVPPILGLVPPLGRP